MGGIIILLFFFLLLKRRRLPFRLLPLEAPGEIKKQHTPSLLPCASPSSPISFALRNAWADHVFPALFLSLSPATTQQPLFFSPLLLSQLHGKRVVRWGWPRASNYLLLTTMFLCFFTHAACLLFACRQLERRKKKKMFARQLEGRQKDVPSLTINQSKESRCSFPSHS